MDTTPARRSDGIPSSKESIEGTSSCVMPQNGTPTLRSFVPPPRKHARRVTKTSRNKSPPSPGRTSSTGRTDCVTYCRQRSSLNASSALARCTKYPSVLSHGRFSSACTTRICCTARPIACVERLRLFRRPSSSLITGPGCCGEGLSTNSTSTQSGIHVVHGNLARGLYVSQKPVPRPERRRATPSANTRHRFRRSPSMTARRARRVNREREGPVRDVPHSGQRSGCWLSGESPTRSKRQARQMG